MNSKLVLLLFPSSSFNFILFYFNFSFIHNRHNDELTVSFLFPLLFSCSRSFPSLVFVLSIFHIHIISIWREENCWRGNFTIHKIFERPMIAEKSPLFEKFRKRSRYWLYSQECERSTDGVVKPDLHDATEETGKRVHLFGVSRSQIYPTGYETNYSWKTMISPWNTLCVSEREINF